MALDMGMSIGMIDENKRKMIEVEDITFLGENWDEEESFKIRIGLIGRGADSRPGRYRMSALKKMIVTDSFLTLSDQERGCQVNLLFYPYLSYSN